jgi:spore coat polysaccharide biosynthesis protein SpsF
VGLDRNEPKALAVRTALRRMQNECREIAALVEISSDPCSEPVVGEQYRPHGTTVLGRKDETTRTAAVIQARVGSTRLPRKVLRPLGGRPVLAWVIAAARASRACDEIVVATTTSADDDDVEAAAHEYGARTVRGPIDDVLTRYLMATDATGADLVVRLTADCPLLDPTLIAMCVRAFDASELDYLSTNHPRSVPHGFDVEVLSADALRAANEVAEGVHRVHVTSYLYTHPDEFRVAGITFLPPAGDLRVTLDEPDDGALLDAVVAELGPRASSWRDVVALLRSRPDLVRLNDHVRQKQLEDG